MSGRFFARAVLFVIASCFAAATAAAQTPSPPPQPPQPAQSGAAADAQAIRDEVAKLRDEFEQVRQQYDARLAALEGRLATLEGARRPVPGSAASPERALQRHRPETPATPPAEAPAPQTAAAPPEAQVPAGAASGGGPEGTLPVYGNTSAMSKIFNPDIAVIGNFLGAVGDNDIEPAPSLELDEAEASFQAVVDPYAKADFFVAVGPEGAELEEGYLTLTSLPGRHADEGRQDAQRLRQGQPDAQPRAAVDRSAARVAEPRRRRGGHRRQRHLGLEVDSEPVVFPRGDRRGLSRRIRDLPRAHAQRPHLRRALARIPRHLREHEPRSRHVVRLRAQRRLGRQLDAPLRRSMRRSGTGRCAARSTAASSGARELVWSRREQPAPDFTAKSFGYYASGEYQFARRWFSGAPLGLVRARHQCATSTIAVPRSC